MPHALWEANSPGAAAIWQPQEKTRGDYKWLSPGMRGGRARCAMPATGHPIGLSSAVMAGLAEPSDLSESPRGLNVHCATTLG